MRPVPLFADLETFYFHACSPSGINTICRSLLRQDLHHWSMLDIKFSTNWKIYSLHACSIDGISPIFRSAFPLSSNRQSMIHFNPFHWRPILFHPHIFFHRIHLQPLIFFSTVLHCHNIPWYNIGEEFYMQLIPKVNLNIFFRYMIPNLRNKPLPII